MSTGSVGVTPAAPARRAHTTMTTIDEESVRPFGGGDDRVESLCGRWQELCERYLPVAPRDSIWRYSRASNSLDPEQGWKFHLPATVLTAGVMLERVAPLLIGRSVQFKAPGSLRELGKINSGLHYGYCQVGKFITVYPRTLEETASLAQSLHELTRCIPAPSVPFDTRFRADSNVYYRYGAFQHAEIECPDGTRLPALHGPGGGLVPDLREAAGKPAWVSDPFRDPPPSDDSRTPATPLKTTFRAFRAMAQRGKGGVYQAVDLSVQPARLCVLKEGRRNGEPGWDERDGCWRIKHEEQVIGLLRAAGVAAPRIYSSFTAEGNYYLVTEFIEGDNLQSLMLKRKRRFSVAQSLRYAARLSRLVSRMHAAGWVWRDCKPANVIVMKDGILRPLDFEGACPVDRPDPQPWGTPGFTPPEWNAEFHRQSKEPQDLYALGSVIYLLITGKLPASPGPLPIEKLRRNVPPAARRLVLELLDADPRRRPSARAAARELKVVLEGLGKSCHESDDE